MDAAARQIRLGGLDSISIADLMKAANLTHGGFYGHFSSRAALIAEALDLALDRGEASFVAANPAQGALTVKSIVNRYLSPAHRDAASEGCAISALAGDVGRAEDGQLRVRMAERLERSFEEMTRAMGGEPGAEEAAVAAWCAMVGAITLSRVFEGTSRSDQILRMARQSILDLEARQRAEA
ncbi:MAG TPA: TetR/AcrR family transcriptional regulator [Caulobacter sp.]|nr:TetR/AcrR family transcriptional regulator [Caulobacter sp.]